MGTGKGFLHGTASNVWGKGRPHTLCNRSIYTNPNDPEPQNRPILADRGDFQHQRRPLGWQASVCQGADIRYQAFCKFILTNAALSA